MAGDKPSVELCKGINGLDKVVLRETRGSSAEVYLFGGQVTSWKNEHGEELLFVSSKAIFKPPKAVRGGIPICFPQFSSHGNLEQHGFARNKFWSIDTNPPQLPSNSLVKTFVDLILKPTDDDIKIWPHSYEFRLRVALTPGGDLMLTSRIRNTNSDGKPFSFTFAYHTYLLVSDIRFANYFLVSLLHLFYLLNILLQSFIVSITALHSSVISTAYMMPKCDFCNIQRKDQMERVHPV
ncbi:hypothetical protein B296_00055367 [Ensete ventricosum]|uniref:Glucose-6-phosphate 1-epimerase n=1 Tax=Ensete ventricosum TaxID=4639 RepID=A0A426XV10_ENSVE|nr:hypothetical protein B296_00055367 [Ensete ventricosum]